MREVLDGEGQRRSGGDLSRSIVVSLSPHRPRICSSISTGGYQQPLLPQESCKPLVTRLLEVRVELEREFAFFYRCFSCAQRADRFVVRARCSADQQHGTTVADRQGEYRHGTGHRGPRRGQASQGCMVVHNAAIDSYRCVRRSCTQEMKILKNWYTKLQNGSKTYGGEMLRTFVTSILRRRLDVVIEWLIDAMSRPWLRGKQALDDLQRVGHVRAATSDAAGQSTRSLVRYADRAQQLATSHGTQSMMAMR